MSSLPMIAGGSSISPMQIAITGSDYGFVQFPNYGLPYTKIKMITGNDGYAYIGDTLFFMTLNQEYTISDYMSANNTFKITTRGNGAVFELY